ncbi:MAG: DNA repair protein RadA [Ignavibacteriales bacterium]|nr:DNA repair protein RadA [Ignavibacteriales bacterium]
MKKPRIAFVCGECGYRSPKWLGRCPQCDEWNSLVEEEVPSGGGAKPASRRRSKPVALSDLTHADEPRLSSGSSEFDRALGGGFVVGSGALLGGEPGVGKSTLALQTAGRFGKPALYVTGEESARQIKLRADRLGLDAPDLKLLVETELEAALDAVAETNPALVVFDSIQTLRSNRLDNSPGSATQLRECAAAVLEDAKAKSYAALIIGHVTKEGVVAGPKILEHMVDVSLFFESSSSRNHRIVRALKNRYGSVNEIGVFEMRADGLREVANPSELFLGDRRRAIAGSAAAAIIEGTRPLFVEVQALTAPAVFGSAQRVVSGFDRGRLSILLAALEKRAGRRFSQHDVFCNVAGGLRVAEPSVDLAVCVACVSSLTDKPIDPAVAFVGEVGLGGEVRGVSQIERRAREAEKLGFEKLVAPRANAGALKGASGARFVAVDTLKEAIRAAIGD